MKRILTGFQPSGILHVGNYFGAIRPMVEMQDQGEVFVFLADLHALTSVREGERLRHYTREAAIDLLACGIDPERTLFWRQLQLIGTTMASRSQFREMLHAALSGALFLLPYNLIQIQGYSATEAGLAMLPLGLLIGVLSRYSGRVSDRIGARVPLIVGPVLVAAGCAGLALPGVGGNYFGTFFVPVVLAGDYNVIPAHGDVHDPASWINDALFLPTTRASFREIAHLGLTDAIRATSDEHGLYTFWDYQAGAFQKNKGIRIDHLLLSPQAVDRLETCAIDAEVRAARATSDHAPVWCSLGA